MATIFTKNEELIHALELKIITRTNFVEFYLNYDNMSNFLEHMFTAWKDTRPRTLLLSLFCLSSGAFVGYQKAKVQAKLVEAEFV